jgi:broad-specificity NMP kinase
MSGVGKTTAIGALRALGFRAIDMDEPGWASSDEFGQHRWDVARLQKLMGELLSERLFVSGCSEDQVALYPQFSKIILLSAPKSVIAQRLACRTGNSYGKRVTELEEVMRNLDEIEPLLRKSATHEIVTTQPIGAVVEAILDISCPRRTAADVRRHTRLSADVMRFIEGFQFA